MLNVDFERLTSWMLPPDLNRELMNWWLNSLLQPVRSLHASFLAYTVATRAKLAYNAQTRLFEKALNDSFDPELRRIYILNNPYDLPYAHDFYREEQEPDEYEYYHSEGEPVEYYFYWWEHLSPIGFQVIVPSSLQPSEVALRALLDRLKIACTRYEIIYI